jgi:hypothetical protein
MGFYIKTGKKNMQISVVCQLLHNTYWANDRSDDIIEKSMLKSDCFGAFLEENDQQIGFARIVTDDAVFFGCATLWLTKNIAVKASVK